MGACAVSGGVVSAVLNSPTYNTPKTVGDNTAAVVSQATAAVAVATGPNAATTCSFGGLVMQVGTSVQAYSQSSAIRACGDTCVDFRVTQRCTASGLMNNSYVRTCRDISNVYCP